MQERTRWTRYRGHRFAYRLVPASGGRTITPNAMEPVVFLNGAFQSMDSWRRFADALGAFSPVLLVDLPGTGKADPLGADIPLSFLADAFDSLLEVLDLGPIYLIAASYGTPTAYQFAQRFSHRVQRMALCGTMVDIPEHERLTIKRSIRMAEIGDVKALAQACEDGLLCRAPARRVRRHRLARRILTSGIRAMSKDDCARYALNTRRLLRSSALDLTRPPDVPSLLFTGEHDVFTTPNRVADVARAIPGAGFTTVREADHLCHLERFDVVVRLLDQFRRGSLRDAHPVDWTPVRWSSQYAHCSASGPAETLR